MNASSTRRNSCANTMCDPVWCKGVSVTRGGAGNSLGSSTKRTSALLVSRHPLLEHRHDPSVSASPCPSKSPTTAASRTHPGRRSGSRMFPSPGVAASLLATVTVTVNVTVSVQFVECKMYENKHEHQHEDLHVYGRVHVLNSQICAPRENCTV